MSGRFQTVTVASEGAELDENYQKMVADIEEQTQRSGWLFGRGAFDKADLQYLRDFNNSLRYKEVEIEDKEKQLWERERARVEAEAAAAAIAAVQQQHAASLTRRSSGGSAPGAPGLRGLPGVAARPPPLLLPVKVKPAGSKHQSTPQATSPAGSGEQPSSKRPRTETSPTGPAALEMPQSWTGAAAPGPGPGSLRSTQSAPQPTSAGARVTGAAEGPGGAGRSAVPAAPDADSKTSQPGFNGARAQAAPEVSGAGKGGEAAPGAGLAGLLGGYGSDDEEEADRGADGGGGGDRRRQQPGAEGAVEGQPGRAASGGAGAQPLPPPLGLLNPEELLADPRVISEGLLATRPQPKSVQGGDAWDSEEPPSSGEED